MNVVIYNQQDNIINGLNIEISKAIKGEFKVEDIIKTSNGVLDFNRKLNEYLNNPQKITEQTQKVDQQRVEEQKEQDRQSKLNEINSLNTFGSIIQYVIRAITFLYLSLFICFVSTNV